MKHTPGPWKVQEFDGAVWVKMKEASEELWMCDSLTPDYDEWIANAHLIAAAPELLDALKELLEACKHPFLTDTALLTDIVGHHLIDASPLNRYNLAMVNASATIAKATRVTP